MTEREVKAIWVASVPRTGSMWTFNIARELVRAAGETLVPEVVPRDDEKMIEIGSAHIETQSEGLAVLKVHVRLHPDVPRSRFIVPQRDVRDALMSFMRFTHADFERGLEFVRGAVLIDRHYRHFPREKLLLLDYTRIVGTPLAVAAEIAVFMGLKVDSAQLEKIVATYDKASVRKRIAAREAEIIDRRDAGLSVSEDDWVPSNDGALRAFDPATGFQSGHVSDYVEGGWREILTEAQKRAVEALMT